jgi:hypothetical protein
LAIGVAEGFHELSVAVTAAFGDLDEHRRSVAETAKY